MILIGRRGMDVRNLDKADQNQQRQTEKRAGR